jgi:hypothetical protein
VESQIENEAILNKIGMLHAQGFDRIHNAGGTTKDGLYYVGGPIYRYNLETKNIEFLGVPYNSNFYTNSESGHNKRAGESPEDAFIREVLEETGLQINPDSFKELYRKEIPDNRPGKAGKFHTKIYYFVNEFTGNLFTFDGPNPIDAETAAPFWIPADLFIKVIFGGHKKSIEMAIDELCLKNRDYAISLMNIL